MIDNLQIEVCRLRKELVEEDSQLSVTAEKAVDDELSWLNVLSHETSENVQERINLQKALFELEETDLRNRIELQHLDDAIAKQQAIEKDGTVVQALRARRQIILDYIHDNDEAGINYQKEIVVNEKHRCQLQDRISEAMSNNSNRTYLRILSQYRLLGMGNTELQFEMASSHTQSTSNTQKPLEPAHGIRTGSEKNNGIGCETRNFYRILELPQWSICQDKVFTNPRLWKIFTNMLLFRH